MQITFLRVTIKIVDKLKEFLFGIPSPERELRADLQENDPGKMVFRKIACGKENDVNENTINKIIFRDQHQISTQNRGSENERIGLNKQNLTYIAIFLVLLIAVLIFALQPEDRPSVHENPAGFVTVSVEEAREMIEKSEVFVLDVRTPAEFNESHIEGATLVPVTNSGGSNLSPDQLLGARVNEVPEKEKILVYCRSGHRSAAASQVLVDAGHTQVYNMDCGINEWISAGYPVVS